jgi:MFS family permease
VVLVATPALVRDFSPQMGRASAMGFWTIGPVAGSLITSAVVTNTIAHLGAWQDEYVIAGVAGFGVFVISLLGLRELSPRLRDQVMVSEHDRVLVEAKARGVDIEAALERPLRQMLKLDIIGPAVAISLFLIIYYTAVGFFPLFFQTVFGYSTSKANALGNWMWGFQAFGLVAIGWTSDRLKVRKPFMLVGALGAIATTLVFMAKTSHLGTGYYTFVVILVLLGFTLALAFAPWMAAFTETVERRNPALTATGLSIWGMILRVVVTISTLILPFVVHSVTTVADHGTAAQAAEAGADPDLSPAENATVKGLVAAAAKIDPATEAALSANPNNAGAEIKALTEISGAPSATVAKAVGIYTQYPDQLTTALAIDPATQVALLSKPDDPSARVKAVSDISAALHVTVPAAEARLSALTAVPTQDLVFMATTGAPVVTAANQLEALAAVSAPASSGSSTSGSPLPDPKVQSTLLMLEQVSTAQQDSRAQWQHYFWIALAGEILFIPLILPMAGFWDPRKARRREKEHDALVDAELAELGAEA